MDVQAALADIDAVMQKPSGIQGGHAAVAAAVARYYACVCRYCPSGTPYRAQADRYVNLLSRSAGSPTREQGLYGVLAALKEDIASGKLTVFEEVVRADVYADLLAMADGLRSDGYHRAATVIAGAALEDHLRKLAAKNAISTAGKKASEINSELKKAGVYGEALRANIESDQKLRNAAAHGNPGFEGSDTSLVLRVEPMILGTRSFIAQFPA